MHELITLLLDLIDREFKKTDNAKMVRGLQDKAGSGPFVSPGMAPFHVHVHSVT